MTDLDDWFVHTVSVETFLGTGSHVAVYAPAVDVACWVEDQAQLVRTLDSREVTSPTRLFTALDRAATFAPESKVTLPGGRVATVITTSRFDSAALGLGLDHIEVALDQGRSIRQR